MRRATILLVLVALTGCGSSPSSTPTRSATPTSSDSSVALDRELEREYRATKRHRAKLAARARERRRQNPRNRKSFSGNGGLTLAPFTVEFPSTLTWTNDNLLFQIWDRSEGGGVPVNSQAHSGRTYLGPGRYVLQINAVGNWTIKIAPR